MKKITFMAAAIAAVALLASCGATPHFVIYHGNSGLTPNGAESFADSRIYEDADYCTAAVNQFTLSGKAFVNWNTAADGSGTAYSAGDTVTVNTTPLYLYAQWVDAYAGEARVTYHGNSGLTLDGTDSYVDPTVYAAGDSYDLDSNSFSVAGKVFVNWNTTADGNGSSYTAGASVTLAAANLDLYAQWRIPSVLETLKGLTNVVKTRNKVLEDGSFLPLEEWSTSWSSTGDESFDYYAVYSYASAFPGQDKVMIYYADSEAAAEVVSEYLIAEYVYERDSAGDIVSATERVHDGTSLVTVLEWTATYNGQHRYLSYIYREDTDGDGDLEVSENRVCQYASDGINYTLESFLYGEGTDPIADLAFSYDPVYKDDDPTTGIIESELMTSVEINPVLDDEGNPVVDDEGNPTGEVTRNLATSNYYFSWAPGYTFISQQVYYDTENRLNTTIQYDRAYIAGEYRTVSRADIGDNLQTTLTTYEYSDDYAGLVQECVYDTTYGQQLESKYVVSYTSEGYEGDNELVRTEASSYSYEIEPSPRGFYSSWRRPAFYHVPCAHS